MLITKGGSSYKRPGGIFIFLQNNTDLFSIKLLQPLYYEILKYTWNENQCVIIERFVNSAHRNTIFLNLFFFFFTKMFIL